jgi:putative glutamine amidotransferase
MSAPLIGVTPSRSKKSSRLHLLEDYTRSILTAGGIPLIIPLELSGDNLSQLAGQLDGIMLTGGGDIDKEHFGGKRHPRISNVEPLRDEMEIILVRLAAERKLPFLGICRGIQVINVALGGTLYTDIRDQFPGAMRHDYFSPEFPRHYIAHDVHIDANSKLAQSMDTRHASVNSMHHQGLQLIAPGLCVSAHADDGLVEGLELPDHPFGVGVQWHPECLPDSQADQALFRAFVTAAENSQRK